MPRVVRNRGQNHMRRTWIVSQGAFLLALAGFLVSVARAQDDAQAKAQKLIEKAGGVVTRDAKAKGNPVTGVTLIAKAITDAELKEIVLFKELQTLDLSFTLV